MQVAQTSGAALAGNARRRLEEAAMGDKDWFMEGEVDAARRPKNSALELDLDFETTVKPPPQARGGAACARCPRKCEKRGLALGCACSPLRR